MSVIGKIKKKTYNNYGKENIDKSKDRVIFFIKTLKWDH